MDSHFESLSNELVPELNKAWPEKVIAEIEKLRFNLTAIQKNIQHRIVPNSDTY
jgi:hypothetical protein